MSVEILSMAEQVPPIISLTRLHGQCDKLLTVVDRNKLTTLATVDMPWQKYSAKIRVWDKVLNGSTPILGDNKFPSNTV